MDTIVMLFTRDLRVSNNPALAAALRTAERVVPLFVLDDDLLDGPYASPNRTRLLLGCLEDLRGSLRRPGWRETAPMIDPESAPEVRRLRPRS